MSSDVWNKKLLVQPAVPKWNEKGMAANRQASQLCCAYRKRMRERDGRGGGGEGNFVQP